MPIIASGDPMSLRNSVALVSAQTVQGTPVTPATSLGMVMAGVDRQSANGSFWGAGSAQRLAVKGGSVISNWTMNWSALQAGVKPMLARGTRTAGILPWFTLGVGYKDDAGTPIMAAWQIQDCKVGSLSLSLNTGNSHNPLTGSMSGMGMLKTQVTTLSPATLTTAPYYSYEAVMNDGAAFPIVNFTMNVNHNLAPKYRIPGTTPSSFVRGPFTIQEGNEVINGSITMYAPLGFDVQMTPPLTTKTLTLTFTNLDDASTLVITLTTVDFTNENEQQSAEGVLFSANWEATSFTIA